MNQSITGTSAQNFEVDLQWECTQEAAHPSVEQIRYWAQAAVDASHGGEVSVRVVALAEMQDANKTWRGKDKPTNVLSFPADFPAETGINYLGDILICADVLEHESNEQNKPLHAHWAHIVVHGMLHLQGYDHIEDTEAQLMEQREIEALRSLGYPNPYEII